LLPLKQAFFSGYCGKTGVLAMKSFTLLVLLSCLALNDTLNRNGFKSNRVYDQKACEISFNKLASSLVLATSILSISSPSFATQEFDFTSIESRLLGPQEQQSSSLSGKADEVKYKS